MQSTEPFAVLVVEDEFLVAFDLTAMLEGAAFTVLGPVADAAAALALVAQSQPDAALLDVNLGGGKTSYEIPPTWPPWASLSCSSADTTETSCPRNFRALPYSASPSFSSR